MDQKGENKLFSIWSRPTSSRCGVRIPNLNAVCEANDGYAFRGLYHQYPSQTLYVSEIFVVILIATTANLAFGVLVLLLRDRPSFLFRPNSVHLLYLKPVVFCFDLFLGIGHLLRDVPAFQLRPFLRIISASAFRS